MRVEHGHKRVRTYLGGELVADTIRPLLVWEIPYFPAYYIPAEDVRSELLVESGKTEHSPSRGDAAYFNVKTHRAEAADAAEDARRAANAATAGRDAAAQVADFYQAAHEAEQRALEAGRAERAAPGDKRLAWRGSIARRLAYLAALSAVQRGGLST